MGLEQWTQFGLLGAVLGFVLIRLERQMDGVRHSLDRLCRATLVSALGSLHETGDASEHHRTATRELQRILSEIAQEPS